MRSTAELIQQPQQKSDIYIYNWEIELNQL
jgi:hypothetical protein